MTPILLLCLVAMQTPDAERGKRVIQQAIQALGGQAYLNVREVREEGRAFSFSHYEEINGMTNLVNYEHYPDEFRQEQGKHHEFIFVLNGDRAWDATFRGVAPIPQAEIDRILLGRKLSADTILRFRLNEPGIDITHVGIDFIDGQPADVIDVYDKDRNEVKIAIDQFSHCPVQRSWERQLPNHEREQNVETLGKYSPAKNSPVLFPYYVRRERNGIKIFEAFFANVEVGHAPDSLFERPPGKERIDIPSRKKSP